MRPSADCGLNVSVIKWAPAGTVFTTAVCTHLRYVIQHLFVVVWKSCTNMPMCFLGNLWQHFNTEVGRQTKSATADAIQEVQRYLAEGNIARSQDPMTYWDNQKTIHPNLYQLSLQFLCTPASSVPCERSCIKKESQTQFQNVGNTFFFLNKNL